MIGYGYNLAELTTSATYLQGTVKYTYDSEGRLSNITRPDNSWLGISYDSGDRVSGVAHYAAFYFLWTRYSYDDLSRVTRSYKYYYGPTLDLSYSYDARSNVTSKTTTTASGTVTCTYSYDPLGHLATSSQNGSLTRFVYDALGNRSKMNTASGTTTYSYDANSGRMLTAAVTPSGNFTFSYDDNGNLKTRVGPSNTTTYTYDTLNHLTQIVQGGVHRGHLFIQRGGTAGGQSGGMSDFFLSLGWQQPSGANMDILMIDNDVRGATRIGCPLIGM